MLVLMDVLVIMEVFKRMEVEKLNGCVRAVANVEKMGPGTKFWR